MATPDCRRILVDTFSFVGMLNYPVHRIDVLSLEEAQNVFRNCKFESYVGNESTAKLLTSLLGVGVGTRKASRSTTLQPGDFLYVAQYSSPRSPEGAFLSEGARIQWYGISVLDEAEIDQLQQEVERLKAVLTSLGWHY